MSSPAPRRFAVVLAATLSTLGWLAVPGMGLQSAGSRSAGAIRAGSGQEAQSASSVPADLTPYARKAVRNDYLVGQIPRIRALRHWFLRDVIVSNTDPTLNATDAFGDQECSIAINPSNPDQIAIYGFSPAGASAVNPGAPTFYSTDGGLTWTKYFNMTSPPPGVQISCDQTPDYDRLGNLFVTHLSCNTDGIFTGSTTDPTSAAAWQWFLVGGIAQETNNAAIVNVDQPWLLVNRDPFTAAQDNVYVGYDDFNAAFNNSTPRVAVSYGAAPPNFTVDNPSGVNSNVFANPGHRLATDPRTGFVYSVHQLPFADVGAGLKSVQFILNRTTDGGATWSLNGNANGVVVAGTQSFQAPGSKFGTVNALLGGIDHAAVDPNTGQVYYALPALDDETGNNRLFVVRIDFDVSGNAVFGIATLVTSKHAALPSVAVASNGNVGLIYTTFDNFSSDGFPIFSEHLAISKDQAATFTDQTLVTFLSSATDNFDPRQRVLGDYMQLKAVGRYFYGAFNANGIPFGRPIANHDPIFLKAFAGGPLIEVDSTDLQFGGLCAGGLKDLALRVFNTGDENLNVLSIARISGSTDFTVLPNPRRPTSISPDAHVDYTIRFTPTGSPGARTATFRITSDDPDRPTIDVNVTGALGAPNINATTIFNYGTVCVGSFKDLPLEVHNTGTCNLVITSITTNAPGEFFLPAGSTIFPFTLSPDAHATFPIRFRPAASGARAGFITINSNDPDTPALNDILNGTGGAPDLNATVLGSGEGGFGTVCIGESKDVTLRLSNQGDCDLTLTNIFRSGGSADFIRAAILSFPIRVQAGSHFDVDIRFRPTSRGLLTATFQVVSDDPDFPTQAVNFSGTGGAPLIDATTIFNYGEVCVGQFKDLPLEVQNVGDCDLTITNITASVTGEFFLPGGATLFPFVLKPGAHATFPIRFQPSAAGPRTGTITVVNNSDNFPNLTDGLIGVGVVPDISVQGCPVDFGRVRIDDASAHEKEIQICNLGQCDLRVTQVAFVPATTEFQIVEETPTPSSPRIVSKDFCLPFHIRFTPTSCGVETATIQIVSDDPDTPVVVCQVRGETLCGDADDLDRPSGIAFPPTVIQAHGDCFSDNHPAISNKGDGSIRINSVSLSGANAGDYQLIGVPSTPVFLNPGDVLGNGDFVVRFRPQAVGRARRASLDLAVADPVSGATTDTVSIPLCGEGVRPGARLLVNLSGSPAPLVRNIRLQKRGNFNLVRSWQDVAPTTVNVGPPCLPFTYHVEVGGAGTIGTPTYLRPGNYRFNVTMKIGRRQVHRIIEFDITGCDFHQLTVDF